MILLVDAFYRLLKAPKKLVWFSSYFGFLVFIGSLPIPFMVLARLLWYRLVVRRIRRSDVRSMADMVVEQRAQSTLLAVLLTALFVLEAGSITVLAAEAGSPGANIQTAGDALWWSMVTIATVGYGDRYPVSLQGRLVGVFMMIVGVGVFSVLTSYLAHTFLRTRKKRVGRKAARPETVQSVRETLADVKDLIDQHDQAHQESLNILRSRIADLEAKLGNKE
jgi:voltage-gated potassium channel